MYTPDIDKAYVSPYDKFLAEFDVKHEKSASQIQEIKKHQRIAKRRDDANASQNADELWEQF